MATCIEVTKAGAFGAFGPVPVEGILLASAAITPTGSNQATAFTGLAALTGPDGAFVTITADENVFISIGTAPNALTDPAKRAMAAGSTRSFAFAVNQQVAVVTR